MTGAKTSLKARQIFLPGTSKCQGFSHLMDMGLISILVTVLFMTREEPRGSMTLLRIEGLRGEDQIMIISQDITAPIDLLEIMKMMKSKGPSGAEIESRRPILIVSTLESLKTEIITDPKIHMTREISRLLIASRDPEKTEIIKNLDASHTQNPDGNTLVMFTEMPILSRSQKRYGKAVDIMAHIETSILSRMNITIEEVTVLSENLSIIQLITGEILIDPLSEKISKQIQGKEQRNFKITHKNQCIKIQVLIMTLIIQNLKITSQKDIALETIEETITSQKEEKTDHNTEQEKPHTRTPNRLQEKNSTQDKEEC